MSYGNKDIILTSDHTSMLLNEFIDPFKHITSLKHKPKLFFIQTSRINSDQEMLQFEFNNINMSPLETDFLFTYSTLNDYYTLNDPKSGSFYIQTLCDFISTQTNDDILTILKDVNSLVSKTKQIIPVIESRLEKKFYFFKKSLSKQYIRSRLPNIKNYGKLKFQNGEYEGGLIGRKRNGNGTLIYSEGDRYIGKFRNDRANGTGKYFFASGNSFVGEFENDRLNGRGTFYFQDGNKYVGEWKRNKPNGNGTFYFLNGNKYIGEFKDSKFNGNGILYFVSGNKFIGEFKDGKPNGNGILYYADGSKYVCKFKDEKIVGNGKFYSATDNYCDDFI